MAFFWLAVGVFWAFEAIRSQFSIQRLLEQVAPNSEEEFAWAQREYLRGNWYEAEAKLLDILERHPTDVAAGLALVGVLRHTGRRRTALTRLEQIGLLDAAGPWQFEIMRESALIRAGLDEGGEVSVQPDDATQED